jgi:hypothetical protein
MQPISYARHQLPAEIIRHAIWLYLRFTLSYRDVEELLWPAPMKWSGSNVIAELLAWDWKAARATMASAAA